MKPLTSIANVLSGSLPQGNKPHIKTSAMGDNETHSDPKPEISRAFNAKYSYSITKKIGEI